MHADTAPTPDQHAAAVAALLAPVLDRLADPARAEHLSLDDAFGRMLAADATSPIEVPPFANSQMDGYAVRAADIAAATTGAPVTLSIGRTCAAGDPVGEHIAGTASPIMTGAPMPAGADAVVQIEVCDPPRFHGTGQDGREAPAGASVSFSSPVEPCTFARTAGSDLAEGAVVLTAGARLSAAQLGSLAACGIAQVPVRPRPRVLLLSTGHELVSPGAPLASGQIYDANTTTLTAALREAGAEVHRATAPDDADAVHAIIAAHPDADLLITTGGVSAGAFEVVRDALENAGVRFGHVAMQPGGPQGLGMARLQEARLGERDLPVIAFPGNPVSALLSFELFLRPLLRAASGLSPHRPRQRAPLAHDLVSPRGKHQVRRGILQSDGSVAVGAPGSHLLHDYARATVLAHIPIGIDALPAGAEVEVWRIDDNAAE